MEYFIVANSKAAPMVSDQSNHFAEAGSPKDALLRVIHSYSHPAGFYSASVWSDANSYHKHEKPLLTCVEVQGRIYYS